MLTFYVHPDAGIISVARRYEGRVVERNAFGIVSRKTQKGMKLLAESAFHIVEHGNTETLEILYSSLSDSLDANESNAKNDGLI